MTGLTSITSSSGLTLVTITPGSALSLAGTVQGDSTTTVAMVGLSSNIINFAPAREGADVIPSSQPLYDFISSQLGIKLGRFLDGKFSFMP